MKNDVTFLPTIESDVEDTTAAWMVVRCMVVRLMFNNGNFSEGETFRTQMNKVRMKTN